jgi:hypothetical protein
VSVGEPWGWAAVALLAALVGLAGWLAVRRNRREAVIERESGRRADEHHKWVVRRLRLECRKLRRETDRGFD